VLLKSQAHQGTSLFSSIEPMEQWISGWICD